MKCSAHAAPASDCECGIYAARAPAEAARYLVGRDDSQVVQRVIGRVALWGVVFAGREAWRAAYAYPNHIWIPSRDADDTVAAALRAYGATVDALATRVPSDVAAALAA